jgi:hypothetical protein
MSRIFTELTLFCAQHRLYGFKNAREIRHIYICIDPLLGYFEVLPQSRLFVLMRKLVKSQSGKSTFESRF